MLASCQVSVYKLDCKAETVKKSALIATVVALAAATPAAYADVPTRLAKADTTSDAAVASGWTRLTFNGVGDPIPQPYAAFGFRAITTHLQQGITLNWSLRCHRGVTSVGQSGVARGRGLVIVWRAPTIRRADYCTFNVLAFRQFGSGGRLIATILGRR
jgi:hypothetical protein